MNSRIEIVSPDTVHIIGKYHTTVTADCRGFELDKFSTGDREAVEALRDCLNCYLETGDFAAISDESATPYAGKEIRLTDNTKGRVECVESKTSNRWTVFVRHENDSYSWFEPRCLLPLTPPKPPQPKYRPYTPVEAAEQGFSRFQGREFFYRMNDFGKPKLCRLNGIGPCGINSLESGCVTYESFAEKCTWADTGEPCGAREVVAGAGGDCEVDLELPLTPPKPEVRPCTPVEAAKYLESGRVFYFRGYDDGNILSRIDRFGIQWHSFEVDDVPGVQKWLPYETFRDGCTWADTGEPCGVREK